MTCNKWRSNSVYWGSPGYWGSNHEEFLLNFSRKFYIKVQFRCLYVIESRGPYASIKGDKEGVISGEEGGRGEADSPGKLFVTVIDILGGGDLIFIIQTLIPPK